MIQALFELVFPKSCLGCRKTGTYICPSCYQTINFHPTQRCAVCNRNSITGATHPRCMSKWAIDGVWAAASNQGVLRKTIHRWKYDYSSELTSILAKITTGNLPPMFNNFNIITPVPLHPSRRRWRGFNQADKLAGELMPFLARHRPHEKSHSEIKNRHGFLTESQTQPFEMTIIPDLLLRTKHNIPQMQIKDRETRLKNLKNAFKINSKAMKHWNHKTMSSVLLIDDIATTGTSLRESAKPLKRAGAQTVWGVVVAR